MNLPNIPVLRVGFVLCPDFTMVAFSGFLDTLRLAADEGDRSRPISCKWEVLSHDMRPIRCSAGVEVIPTSEIISPDQFDYIVVVGGLIAKQKCAPSLLDFIQLAGRMGIPLVGLCTGSFVLARLGLMTGRRCCVSWFHHESFVDEFPTLAVTSEALYIADGDRITCAGGTSVVHLAAHIVQKACGPEKASKALRILIEESREHGSSIQPAPFIGDQARDPRLRRAVLLIERNIESPISCEFVARQVKIGVRQLERLFKRELGTTPSAFGEKLRLERAKELLRSTHEPLFEVAIRCGYRNHSHFASRFRSAYGLTPTEVREGDQQRVLKYAGK